MERVGTVAARVVEDLRHTVDKKAGKARTLPAKVREDGTSKADGKGRGESTADQCIGLTRARARERIGGGYIGPDPPLVAYGEP